MHDAAFSFVSRAAATLPPRRSILECGSRDVNGSVRSLFPDAAYLGIDVAPGPGVNVVADAATFDCNAAFDTVICTEVLEHAENAPAVCKNAHRLLRPGGVFLVTAASGSRAPHSAVDGGILREGEFYRNVSPAELREWLADFGLALVDAATEGDVYALAVKW